MRTLWRVCLALVLAVGGLLLPGGGAGAAEAAPGSPAGAEAAAPAQAQIFSHTAQIRTDRHFRPVFTQPANWVAPVNFRDGQAYLRLAVSGKPTTKALNMQVCMWRHNGLQKFFWETCSDLGKTITTNGTYYFSLGSPGRWWKKVGGWDFTKAASDIRVMVIDPVTKKLVQTQQCGANCYPGTGIFAHLPFTVSAEFIVVGAGATLTPPASWQGCPQAISTRC